MDRIAEALFETLIDANLEALAKAMTEWQTKYSVSYNACRRIPAFRKLWDAMDEACRYQNER